MFSKIDYKAYTLFYRRGLKTSSMYLYLPTSKHRCNISTYCFFQLLSYNRNPDESKGKFLAPPKMAGASSVTDTCCLEAMTQCSEIP